MKKFPNIPESEKQKKWFQLLEPIVERRLLGKNPENSPLLKVLSINDGVRSWKTIKKLLEFALNNVYNADKLFTRVTNQMKFEADDHDEIINGKFAELSAIPALELLGFLDIGYQKDGLDFIAYIKNDAVSIEVTYLGGTGFSTQTMISKIDSSTSLYRLTPKKLISKLKNKHDSEKKQIEKHCVSRAIIFIITSLEEAHPFWLKDQPYDGKHPMQAYVDDCEIPTMLLAPGMKLYVTEKLQEKLLPFDRNKYVELAYGIDAKVYKEQDDVFQKALETMLRTEVTIG